MEFKKRGDKVKKFAPVGETHAETYELRITTKGEKELVCTGKTNRYEMIQASAEQCEIYNILRRHKNGDYGALEKVATMYGDYTNTPKTLAEAQQMIITLNNTWDNLPKDIREKYGNNVENFIANIDKIGEIEKPKINGIPEAEPIQEKGAEI